ncbi:response regulator transcription factor [Blastococcus sp. CT_GayMR19]|uniref:response regulator transcription factor n=1 Tax=Blastococcus sp. CT_GayMR19 TaxID=2559608 RepID=UPI00107446D8|nr:response regulator transcription factor [Blastococcus sp. CT_GayMR19]TFV79389.1 response regulator transcription factor [Blastococcus sp. CT_GayMR19]
MSDSASIDQPDHSRPVGTVLVVDDEPKIRELVGAYLRREGYHVVLADNGIAALRAAERLRPDLLILDLGLPDVPGEELLRLLRRSSDLPVIMLTARASEGDRVAGLRLGADDYVTKPFSPRELVARVEAVLRRAGGGLAERAPTYAAGRLIIDGERREVSLDGAQLELTRSEFDLLVTLASRPGRAWTRYELVTRVQGHDYEGYERTVDAHVKNLRRKLGDDPRQPTFVVTVPSIGYKFGPPADD